MTKEERELYEQFGRTKAMADISDILGQIFSKSWNARPDIITHYTEWMAGYNYRNGLCVAQQIIAELIQGKTTYEELLERVEEGEFDR